MLLTEIIRQSVNSLKINTKRTMLTVIGIVIGLSSVLFITSIGDTITHIIDEFIVQNVMEGVNISVLCGYTENEGFTDPTRYIFTKDEIYDFIESSDGMILDYDGWTSGNIEGRVTVDSLHKSHVTLEGVSSAYEKSKKLQIVSGRFINRDECRYSKPTAVISDISAEELFGSAEASLGREIEIIGVNEKYLGYNEETYEPIYEESAIDISFVVVGVYHYVADSLFGTNGDKTRTPVYGTYSYVTETLDLNDRLNVNNSGGTPYFPLALASRSYIPEVMRRLDKMVSDKFGNDPEFTYEIENPERYFDQVKLIIKIISIAFVLIGGISLLVGGIGLMNTMLVSVTERTKEIGIKKALGAKNSTIRLQFLAESAIICLFSCAVGVFFGFLFGLLIESNLDKLLLKIPNETVRYFLQNTEIHVTPSTGSIIFSSLFSIAVGIVFGLYPANKGAKMQPVDALRYE